MSFPSITPSRRLARGLGVLALAAGAVAVPVGVSAAQAAPAPAQVAPAATARPTAPATTAAAPATTASAPAAARPLARPVARAAATPAAPLARTVDVKLTNPYPAKDRLAAGWTVVKPVAAAPVLRCATPSVSGWTANTYTCTPTAFFAVACYAKTGYRDVVTCVVDPHRRRLAEYRTAAPLPRTGLAPSVVRRPVGSVLVTGAQCRLTTGAATRLHQPVVAWAGCDDRATTRLWQAPDGTQQYRVVGKTIQYRAGTEDVRTPVTWASVRYRYWLG